MAAICNLQESHYIEALDNTAELASDFCQLITFFEV
jgi:hypothetical protein